MWNFPQIKINNKLKMSKLNGKVKFFSDKGFGFIVENQTGVEVFVHATGLLDEIRENDEVEYEVVPGKKGNNAVNVRVLN